MTGTTISAPEAMAPASSAPSKRSWLPLAVVGVTLLTSVAFFFKIQATVEAPGERTPHRYLLPQDFTGKIRILYNVAGAKALPLEEDHLVVDLPLSGMFETSTPFKYGTARDQFFRELEDGTMEHLHGNHLKERKIGVVGDDNEYYDSPSETELWRQEMRRRGWVGQDGGILLGGTESEDPADMIHYELMIVRDDY